MVRNGGSAHVYDISDVVDADFAMAEQPENAQAGGIADELKSFGSFFKSLCGRHVGQDAFNLFAMVAMGLQFF